jgi:aryl-alcohol dehydrogenase-like predicted oxidoreductase
MRYRLLGQTGLRVSELFLAAMTFGDQGAGGGAPSQECRRILDRYADAGGNVVDTAVNYSGGQSETILGELLGGRRDRFVVATKCTMSRDGSDPNAAGSHRKNLTLSLETSLRQLRTNYIDVYWVHLWDSHTPVEETMRALDDAVRAGKVLYVGISDAPAWVVARANTLAEWRGWTPFAGLQVPYNLLDRDIERELLPMAEAFGLTVAAWGPLASGVLSGKLTRRQAPRPVPASQPTHSVRASTPPPGPYRRSPTTSGPRPRRWPLPGPARGPGRSTRSWGPGPPGNSKTTWAPSTSHCQTTPCSAWNGLWSSPSGSPATSSPTCPPLVFGEVTGRLDGR